MTIKADNTSCPVPRFTGKTQITGKAAGIPERPKNISETLIGDYCLMNIIKSRSIFG